MALEWCLDADAAECMEKVASTGRKAHPGNINDDPRNPHRPCQSRDSARHRPYLSHSFNLEISGSTYSSRQAVKISVIG